MKVKELIEKLKKLDQEATVIMKSSNFEMGNSEVALSCIFEYNTASKKFKTFKDAFDGENYDAEVWSIIGGKDSVIYLS